MNQDFASFFRSKLALAALTAFSSLASAACDVPTVLRRLAKDEAKGAQTFLVSSDPNEEQWVYWIEKKSLLLVGKPANDDACRSPRLLVSRRLSLDKDVVETEAEVGSSTYLVTRAWAAQRLFTLAKDGARVQTKEAGAKDKESVSTPR